MTETQSPGSLHPVVGRFCIYVLLEAGKHVRYVGITKQRPERRMLQHYADASRKRTDHKTSWIRHCVAEGIPIELKVLRKGLSECEACRKEIRLIRFFGKAFHLVNSHEGGATGYSGLSFESKAKHLASTRKALSGRDWKTMFARMRAAKEKKRLENPVEREPQFVRFFPLEICIRDKVSGQMLMSWTDLRSVRNAAKRLSIVLKNYA